MSEKPEEKHISANPYDHSYWRNMITVAIKKRQKDDFLSVEDFLEGCCVKAYKQGIKKVLGDKEVAEVMKMTYEYIIIITITTERNEEENQYDLNEICTALEDKKFSASYKKVDEY